MIPIVDTASRLALEVDALRWHTPSHVYNPLDYAWASHRIYLTRYGQKKGRVLMLGMNPGPWGMAQTGVPFGDVLEVRDWLGIDEPLGTRLPDQHASYPLLGMGCHRREGSGRRFWGWARARFGTPAQFFDQAFVWNYCPLLFIHQNRNLVPEKLSRKEQQALMAVCDQALREVIAELEPRLVVGIGRYAEQRLRHVTGGKLAIRYLLHPSPANPAANRDWDSHANALFGPAVP